MDRLDKIRNLKLYKAKLSFNAQKIGDVQEALIRELEGSGLNIPPGGEIVVATGSRGVANIALMVRTICDYVRAKGGKPFIVPAMGSHGGASAEGQEAILAEYGITEATMNAPVRSCMDVVEIDNRGMENKVYMDRLAWESDGVILINRVKPHTDFRGALESGVSKMSVIGLGKHKLAMEIHSWGAWGLANLIEPTAKRVFEQKKILLGIAVVENAYDQTALIKALKPEDIIEEEKKLLLTAREWMPALPVDQIDALLIDWMGKNISGCGMDTNIIGRIRVEGMADNPRPKIGHIIVDDLTDLSHGNATGTGLADIMTRKLFDKIDFHATYENTLTSSFLLRGPLPMIADNALQALQWSFRGHGRLDPDDARIIRIQDTLHLGEMYVSKALSKEVADSGARVSDEPSPLFNNDGTLAAF